VSETSAEKSATVEKKSELKLSKPAWYKNTYFWIAGVLFILGIVGLPFLGGDNAIRDPGQKRENGLYLLYFLGAVIMLVNGWLSHSQTVQHYRETLAGKE
jgi:hypothetical protein